MKESGLMGDNGVAATVDPTMDPNYVPPAQRSGATRQIPILPSQAK